jgi:hypothetical protein
MNSKPTSSKKAAKGCGEETPERPSPYFAYSIEDMRDRYPDPYPTIEAMIAALREGRYVLLMGIDLWAHRVDGGKVLLPRELYIKKTPAFKDRAEAEAWVLDRQQKMVKGDPLSKLRGVRFANPDHSVEEQIDECMAAYEEELMDASLDRQIIENIRSNLLKLDGSDNG